VTILRDGRNACEGVLIKELDKQKIVTHMIGRDEDVSDIGKRKNYL